jgi:hypothetical protein
LSFLSHCSESVGKEEDIYTFQGQTVDPELSLQLSHIKEKGGGCVPLLDFVEKKEGKKWLEKKNIRDM